MTPNPSDAPPSMTIPDLRTQLALPPSTKKLAVLNHALRRLVPGGTEVLDTLGRLHEMQHGRPRPDPALQEMLDDLRDARDKMCNALLDQAHITKPPQDCSMDELRLYQAEYARRSRLGKPSPNPKVIKACPECGGEFGVAELRKHLPACRRTQRPAPMQ